MTAAFILTVFLVVIFGAWAYGCLEDALKMWRIGKTKYAVATTLCGIGPVVLVVWVIGNMGAYK